jgi:hypothetical protein
MSFTRSGGTAPAFSFPIGTGTFTDVNASNAVFTSNVYSSFYRGDGGLLTNVTASIPSTFANLVVSNSVTTTNVFATIYRGDGGLLSNITGSSVSGNVANATVSLVVSQASQPNITSVGTLTGLTVNGSLISSGQTSFSNIIVANLSVTNNFIITATNVQSTNAISIVNQGTTTALYVNQNEFPNMTYNVAEFWDHTQLAMVIDGYGNVAVHTASSPGYAFTVVQGASIDNLTTTNVFATTANVGTLNVQQVSNLATLSVTNNIFAPNALTTTNVLSGILSVTGSINYTDDLFKRGPYLPPSTSNAAAIQAWISSTCNNASTQGGNSWWSRSNRPNFSNLVTKGTSGSFAGSVVLNDGRVLFVPFNSTTIGIFNPATNQYSSITPSGAPTFTVGNEFIGGVLVPDGDVVFIPYNNSNVCIFNPSTYAFSNVIRHGAPIPAFFGGCLDPFGNVVCVPASSTSNIGTFDPVLNTFSNVAKPNAGGGFGGGVTLPNGNIVCIPYTNSNIVQFNPYTGTVSNSLPYDINTVGTVRFRGGVLGPMGNVNCVPSGTTNSNIGVFNPNTGIFSNIVTNAGGTAFQGGCLLPSGRILFAPLNSSNIGLYDPYTLTYSNSTPVGGLASSFVGCSLIRDGRVVFAPNASANVGVVSTLTIPPPEFVMSPFFNKY